MGKSRGNVRFIVRPMVGDDPNISDEVPDFLAAKAVLEVLYNVEAEIAPAGWDQPPGLAFLYRRHQVATRDLLASYMELSWLGEATPPMMRAKRPWHTLVDLGEKLREGLPEHLRPKDLVGVVFACEGWQVISRDEEQAAANNKAAWEHKLHEHPDRIEVRMLHCADVDRVHYLLQRERDGVLRHQATLLGRDFVGDVPNALHFLMAAIQQGKDAPTWAEWKQLYRYDTPEDLPRESVT